MITERELDTLETFHKMSKVEYCDFWKYSIVCENGSWALWLFNEIDGELYEKLADLTSMEQLKEIYEIMEGETLV